MIIKVKLDVSKIDKNKLFKGEKGIYLDATILLKDDQPADSYGNHGMIVQDVTKAEREAGQKGPILGNVKIMGAVATKTGRQATSSDAATTAFEDLPF